MSSDTGSQTHNQSNGFNLDIKLNFDKVHTSSLAALRTALKLMASSAETLPVGVGG